jgi:Zn-dependent protease
VDAGDNCEGKGGDVMLASWKVGRLFGIRVYVHFSCLLLVLLALGMGSGGGGLGRALATAALVPAVFVCVLLHEFGHALTARRFGIRTRDITLYFIGGVARLEGLGRRPWEELVVALAGPAVNLVIAAALAVVFLPFGLGLTPDMVPEDTPLHLAGSFVFTLLAANLMLAVFNLIPAFPMDGGRVVRSLLQLRLGRLRATEIAARVGLVLALLLAVGAPVGFWFFTGSLYLAPVPVALFVAFAGQRELWSVRRLEEERAREAEEESEALPVEAGAPDGAE